MQFIVRIKQSINTVSGQNSGYFNVKVSATYDYHYTITCLVYLLIIMSQFFTQKHWHSL
jgi:hypothetical protein